MSRHTDVNALKEFIGKVRAEYNFFIDEERPHYEAHSKALELLNIYLDNVLTIDIVRCGDCKHWNEFTYVCDRHYINSEPYDFCSYGERSE